VRLPVVAVLLALWIPAVAHGAPVPDRVLEEVPTAEALAVHGRITAWSQLVERGGVKVVLRTADGAVRSFDAGVDSSGLTLGKDADGRVQLVFPACPERGAASCARWGRRRAASRGRSAASGGTSACPCCAAGRSRGCRGR